MIRRATRKDSNAIAACLLQAMEEIVYQFIGERDLVKAEAFLRYFVEKKANQYSYQNCFVAETEGEITGAVNVYHGEELHRLRQPVLDYIQHFYGQTLQPEDETSHGEVYIDSLGVLPGHQGKGTGASLLRFLIDEYVHRQKQILGLLVDEDNPDARRLYLRLGFKPVGEKTLLGKRMIHLQFRK